MVIHLLNHARLNSARTRLLFMLMLLCLLPIMVNSAQAAQSQTDDDATCPALVETALEAVDEFCANTGRNQACYGNFNLEAQARATAEDFHFETIGDIANVSDITSLRLNGMNEENGEWGVVLLRLQTSLPDTLPGQNVTFILFGDVEVTNAVDEDQIESGEMTPMQAFYLTTGIGDAQCSEAPDSGLIVQTPEGVGEVAFTVNEVAVQMGSTVLFQANPDAEDGEMTVTTIEGAAALNLDGEAFPIIEGTMARMPIQRIGGRLRPPRLPERIETYDDRRLQGLPLNQLERRVQPPPPLNGLELIQVRQRFRNGMAMCGQAPFPPCDHIPGVIGGLPCIIPSMIDRLTPEQQAGRSICNVQETPIDQLPPPQRERDCVRPPRPNDPPLAPEDNRPICAEFQSGGGELPPPNGSGTGQLPPPPNGSGNITGNATRLPTLTPVVNSNAPTPTPLPTRVNDSGGTGNLPPPPNGGGGAGNPPPPPGG